MMQWNELTVKATKNELTMQDLIVTIAERFENVATQMKGLRKEVAQNTRDMTDVKEEYPLLPPEADDLSKAVQRKGVECMGGKKSAAYQNTDIRRRVYRDIYTEIKRNYGLIDDMGRQQSYKKLKRKYLKGAFVVVDSYILPIALQNEVDAENEIEMED